MFPIIRFLLKDFFRSANYFAPFLLFALMVVAQYSFATDRMVDTYSMTALYLYFISGWLSLKVFATEDPTQQIITSLNAKSPEHYFLAKLFVSFFVIVLLGLFAVAYPLIFNCFIGPTPFLWVAFSLLAHLILGALALIVGALFNPVLVRAKSMSIGGTLLVLLIFLIKDELLSRLLPDQAQRIGDLLPPLPRLLNILQADSVNIQAMLLSELWIVLYCAALVVIYVLQMRRKSGLTGRI